MNKTYEYVFFANAYKALLQDLMKRPEYQSEPRGQKCKEITNVVLTIEKPDFNLYNNTRRSSAIKYICAELIWYFSGTNKIDYIKNYASMWDLIKNPDGTVNSAYGHLLFTEKNQYGISQWEWARKSLIDDKDSRQAFMHFNKPHHQWYANKDQVCTLNGIFHIRENKLNFTIDMRSNDAILGLPTDFAFFNILHQEMLLHLKEYYPELTLGSYTHISHSMHIYERNFKLVEEMLEHDFTADSLPTLDVKMVNSIGVPTNAESPFVSYIKETANGTK